MSGDSASNTDEESREMLARHTVVAVFGGLEPGKEPMLMIYPPRPAKTWAAFDIEAYEHFEKPGKYGDEKQKRFAFVPDEQTPTIQAVVAGLAPGTRVRLGWQHDYVTRTETAEDGRTCQSKSPERPVVLLDPLP